jgi:hypothetical protein
VVIYLIGDLVRSAEVSAETIRRWCGRGLLHPQRDSSGRRIFSLEDFEIANRLATRPNGWLPDLVAGQENGDPNRCETTRRHKGSRIVRSHRNGCDQ